MNFPSFPGFAGRLFAAHRRQGPRARRHPGVQRLAHRRVVRRLPRPLHPDGAARALGPGAGRGRGPADGREGLPLGDVHREPGDARTTRASTPTHWDPFWAAARRHGHRRVDPPGLVGGKLVQTSADAPVDVMITLQPMIVCQCAADIMWSKIPASSPASASPSRRAGPAGSRTSSNASTAPTTCTTSGPARTSASKLPSEIFREHFLTCFIDDPVGVQAARPDRHRQHELGAATTRTPTRPGRTRRRSSEWCSPTPHRRGRRQDHARERDALVLVRPVHARAGVRSRRWRRSAPSHPITT